MTVEGLEAKGLEVAVGAPQRDLHVLHVDVISAKIDFPCKNRNERDFKYAFFLVPPLSLQYRRNSTPSSGEPYSSGAALRRKEN